jgi:hypothetical protein
MRFVPGHALMHIPLLQVAEPPLGATALQSLSVQQSLQAPLQQIWLPHALRGSSPSAAVCSAQVLFEQATDSHGPGVRCAQ